MSEHLAIMEHITIIITGLAGIFGAILVLLSKLGVISNKKPSKRAYNVSAEIEKLKKELQSEIDNDVDKSHETHVRIFEKLEDLSNDVSYLQGLLKKSEL